MITVLARLAAWNDKFIAFRGLTVVRPRLLIDLVGAEAPLARPAVDHRIGEVVEVAARPPDSRGHEDRRVEPDHVGAQLYVVTPPDTLHVIFEQNAERSVIPARAGAAVNLARLKNEAAPLAQ